MKKFFFDCGTRDALASSGLLVLRVSVGLMMLIGHGLPKWRSFDKILENGFHVPGLWPLSLMSERVSLGATLVAEIGAAALLVLGLATRPAAFVLAFAMAVAAFEVHAHDPFFLGGGAAKEPAVLYLVACLVLVITGAGRWSVDIGVYKEKKKRFF